MKLFVCYKIATNEIVAISEERDDVVHYMRQKGYQDTHSYTTMKGDSADTVMRNFDDLYLEDDPDLDLVFTRVERNLVLGILEEERARLNRTLEDMLHYAANYAFSKKESKTILKTYSILKKTRKTKRLRKAIQLDPFIGLFSRTKMFVQSFQENLNTMANKIYIFARIKDDE